MQICAVDSSPEKNLASPVESNQEPKRFLEESPKEVHKEQLPEITLESENGSDDIASDLYFERETSIPDFEREAVYDVDSFEKKSTRAEKLLAPPPDFQKSLKVLSPDLQKSFKTILNGDIIGIWPIKKDFLLK